MEDPEPPLAALPSPAARSCSARWSEAGRDPHAVPLEGMVWRFDVNAWLYVDF